MVSSECQGSIKQSQISLEVYCRWMSNCMESYFYKRGIGQSMHR